MTESITPEQWLEEVTGPAYDLVSLWRIRQSFASRLDHEGLVDFFGYFYYSQLV